MSLFDLFYSWLAIDAIRKIFGSKPMPKSDHQPMPDIFDIGFDHGRYNELSDRLDDLESRLDDYDDAGFDSSLDKVARLLGRKHLSDDDLDRIERTLDHIECRMDDYDDRLDIDDDATDDFDSDDDFDDDFDDDYGFDNDFDNDDGFDDHFNDYDYDSDLDDY